MPRCTVENPSNYVNLFAQIQIFLTSHNVMRYLDQLETDCGLQIVVRCLPYVRDSLFATAFWQTLTPLAHPVVTCSSFSGVLNGRSLKLTTHLHYMSNVIDVTDGDIFQYFCPSCSYLGFILGGVLNGRSLKLTTHLHYMSNVIDVTHGDIFKYFCPSCSYLRFILGAF
jgi:predicted nucleic-acid-binding Zn-ribbon protein